MGRRRQTDRVRIPNGQALRRAAPALRPVTQLRICRIEEMEPRKFLAADVHLGAVYFEDATGDDSYGDILQITFEGGAPGTELTRLVIDGDKDHNGPSAGDIFFDTQSGGKGVFGSAPLKLVSHEGFQVLGYTVVDGGSQIVFDLSGFKAGMKLVFSIDTDEIQYLDPTTGTWDSNALVEGGEFQRTHLEGTFKAPGYENATGHAQFWDAYDDDFATAATAAGSVLNLPPDRYTSAADLIDRTAGAVTRLAQQPLPGSLSGYVLADLDGDGLHDPDERGIVGVRIDLLDADGNLLRSTTTDANGRYQFDGVAPGQYQIREYQPSGYLDGDDHPGSLGGVVSQDDLISQIVVGPGQHGVDYNFCEYLPGSLRGHVHADLDGDCERDPGEAGIAGVIIKLYNAAGDLVATTTTDADGNYAFDDLAPGKYTIEEVQPAGYFDGGEFVGSAGGMVVGNDKLGQIRLGSGQHGTNYNFCDKPPATIGGYVFQDGGPITSDGRHPPNIPGVRDGVRSPDDTPLAGIVLELRNGITGEPIYVSALLGDNLLADKMVTAVTDANGYYQFTGLPPGIYAVYKRADPSGYVDGLNTAGTAGGIAIGAWQVAAGNVIDQLKYLPASGDAILQIMVNAGQASHENNFSEVVTRSQIIIYKNPEPDPPPVGRPGAYVPFSPPTTYTVIPPQSDVPRFLYGGSTMNYSWHLSVIDAGNPRGGQAEAMAIQQTAGEAESPLFKRRAQDKARWVLVTRDASGLLTQQRVVQFGPADGIPITGDFDGDGITDLAIFADGQWHLDANGDGAEDATDLWAHLGSRDDLPVTGDWNGDGKADIGIYGPAWPRDPHAIRHEPGIADAENAQRDQPKNLPPEADHAAQRKRHLRTAGGRTREDLIDHVFHYGTAGDMPVAGDWNGDGVDTIGVFRDGLWHRDTDGDGRTTAKDQTIRFGLAGDLPVTGDWNGDGITDVGVYRRGVWYLDSNGNGQLDSQDEIVRLGTAGDRPITGDFDGDGQDEIGVVGGRQSVGSG